MNYLYHLVIFSGIYCIVAMSLNIVVGYCGYISLAHAGYFALGGYSYGLLSRLAGWEFLPSAVVGFSLAVLLSLLLSLPSLRLKGEFFILISLTVQVLIFSLISNWTSPDHALGSLENLTNGTYGVTEIPRPSIFGFKFQSVGEMAALSVLCATLCAFAVWLVVSSPWGRLLKAMRDDELAARGLGKRTRLAKLYAFAFSCGVASLAGTLYAAYVQFIDHHTASLENSILFLSMVIVGGTGNFRGPIVGALILVLMPEFIRFVLTEANIPLLKAAEQYIPSFRLVIYGMLMVGLIHMRPQGIAGEYHVD